MELQTFKEKYMHKVRKLYGKLSDIRGKLLSEGEEAEPEENWSDYDWPQFYKTALDRIKELVKDADKVYFFVVEDECPTAEQEYSVEFESQMFRDMHGILDCVEEISSDLSKVYVKLTGDCLERAENPYKRDSISGLAEYILEELSVLVEHADCILSFISPSVDEDESEDR